MSVQVREARPDEREAALNVLDAAMLETDRVGESTLLVAVADREEAETTRADSTRVLGALALSGDRIAAVAVRRRRRGQGIGTALVEAARARRERLVAEFDPDVRPFYESLGFEVEPAGEGRLGGVHGRR